jgi:hypothetical protein
MAWPFDNQVDSVLPIDYGVQKLASYANNAMGNNQNTNNRNLKTWPRYDRNNTSALLPNNQNNSGLQWWMNANQGRYASPMMPPMLDPTGQMGASNYRGPQGIPFHPDQGNRGRWSQQNVPDETGFSFNPLNWGIGGMMKKMIEPNTPEENFGLKYFGDRNTLSSSGRTYGNQAYDVFAGKNVASAFGQGMGGAAQKRIDRINKTLSDWEARAAEGDEEAIQRLKTTTLRRRSDEFKKQLAQYNKDLAAGTGGADTTGGYITKTTPDAGGYTGPRTYDFDRAAFQRSGGQRASRDGFTDPGRGSYGPHMAEGGRIGYKWGTPGPDEVDEPAEDIFEFMQDQGINYDQMVEGVDQKFLSDELGAIDVTDEEIAMITDLLGRETDVSTISTLTGKDEGTIERVIRVLTTQSQAQGGSVGYFEGGLARLV